MHGRRTLTPVPGMTNNSATAPALRIRAAPGGADAGRIVNLSTHCPLFRSRAANREHEVAAVAVPALLLERPVLCAPPKGVSNGTAGIALLLVALSGGDAAWGADDTVRKDNMRSKIIDHNRSRLWGRQIWRI